MANLFDPKNSLTTEPETIIVGDFIQWRKIPEYADYPPSTYSMEYVARITAGGSTEIKLAGTDYDSSAWLFQVSSAVSADFVAGFYHWQLEAVRNSDSERLVIERGTFTAVEDLDVNGADPRTHAEIMVDKIESVLENRADSDVDDYSIAGRSLTKMKVKDLLYWRDYYRTEVTKEKRQELIKRGKRVNSTVKVRF